MHWNYAEQVAMAGEAASLLTAAERAAVLHATAARISRLPAAAVDSGMTSAA
jgi:hypothetical protein